MTPPGLIYDEPRIAASFSPKTPLSDEGLKTSRPVAVSSDSTPIISPFPLNCLRPKEVALPKLYKQQAAIKAMVARRNKTRKKLSWQLPAESSKLKKLLKKLQAGKKILWTNAAIQAWLQRRIDRAKGNVHLIYGYNHHIAKQYYYFNELITPGLDRLALKDITHVALENFGHGRAWSQPVPALVRETNLGGWRKLYSGDQQAFIGHYLRAKSKEVKNFLGLYMAASASFKDNRALVGQAVRTVLMSPVQKNPFDVIASDVVWPQNLAFSKMTMPWGLEAREAFAVDTVQARLCRQRKNIVIWAWGKEHAIPNGLPKHISYRDKTARIISIISSGGQNDRSLAFDQAVEELGWADKTFAIPLYGFREGNLIVHLPVEKTAPVFFEEGSPQAAVVVLR